MSAPTFPPDKAKPPSTQPMTMRKPTMTTMKAFLKRGAEINLRQPEVKHPKLGQEAGPHPDAALSPAPERTASVPSSLVTTGRPKICIACRKMPETQREAVAQANPVMT